MKRLFIVCVLACTGIAQADDSVAAGTPLGLIIKSKVQRELRLSADQIQRIQQIYEQANKGDKTSQESLMKELKPEQARRLKEISLQVRGGSVLSEEGLVKPLELSEKQRGQLKKLWINHEEDLRQILRITRFKNAAARRRFILEHRVDAGKEMIEVLTEEQKAKLKKMQGTPFDLKGLDN